ncbi:hypothetical protein [Holdemanella sp. MSK.7.32]|uniref:hypothetical protein n=1 Tax=Holdemanella sp. MSK.7.32 TaxID=2965273 RepID=UPI00210E15D3|nr:hypothetical protein [Holdemanella sp. MSK.7.32]MCQ4803774.1 hypothetical protein [Holdemanella sp. MSK.7.32]
MNLIKFKTIEYVVNTIGNTQKFGLDSMIAIMSFIVSVFALYTTRKIYRVDETKNLYKEVFEDDLLKQFPEKIYHLLEECSYDNYDDCIDSLSQVKEKLYFFQLYNPSLYMELKNDIIAINENIELLMQNCNALDEFSYYKSCVQYKVHKFYNSVYQLSFIKILYYDFLNKHSLRKEKKKMEKLIR